MEDYKSINRELAIRNGDLRLTVADLQKEIVFLNEVIVQVKSENAFIKNSVKKILANSYCKILTEVCGMPNSISENDVLSLTTSNTMQNNEQTFVSSNKTDRTLKEISNIDNSPLKNITKSRRNRNKPQSCSQLPQGNENDYNNSDNMRTALENIEITGMEKDGSERQLQTIIEEENSVLSCYNDPVSSESDCTLAQLIEIITKKNQTCSHVENSYSNNTKEMSSLSSHKTFSDTTLSLLNAPSSTPFKKRKIPFSDNIFSRIPVVKVRRLQKNDLKPLMIAKAKRIPSTKSLKGNMAGSSTEKNVNFTDKRLKCEDNFLSNSESSLKDITYLRPRRRAAPTCFKEIPLKTKMRYDPKKKA